MNADGSPHASNGRSTIDDDDADFWFGFEQEYFLWDPQTDLPPDFQRAAILAHKGPTTVALARKTPTVETAWKSI